MKKFSKTTMIFALFCCSALIAQDSTRKTPEQLAKQRQQQFQEDMKKPYTGWMLDAINGANSPERYRVKKEDDPESRLKKQLVNAIYTEVEYLGSRYESGTIALTSLLEAQGRLLKSQDDFYADDLDQRIEVAKEMVQLAKKLETAIRQKTEAAVSRPDEWAKAVAYRFKCQLHLLRLEKQKK